MNSKQMKDLYEFHSFRLDAVNCRLTRGDDLIPLTPKEFGILVLLVENSDRIVTKEELLESVWKDTFVEEATLARNISWLRKKLADGGAGGAKIIETVPKRGYRFTPEAVKIVENLPEAAKVDGALIVEEHTVERIEIKEVFDIEPRENGEDLLAPRPPAVSRPNVNALPAAAAPRRFSTILISGFLLICAALGFFAYRGLIAAYPPSVIVLKKIAPFSGLPGRENDPSFSPDGKQIVFAWDGGVEDGKMNIYVKLVGAGEPVRLTRSEQDEINPVFSPDGKSVAFVRVFPEHAKIVSVGAFGGAERIIDERASYASLSFSPDGARLAHAELDAANGETGSYTINLQTGERTRLTAPPAPAVDHTPRFSPNGETLAFVRYFNSFRREVLIVPAAGGEARQITFDDKRIYSLAWSVDSRDLFFTSFRAVNQLNLWRVSIKENSETEMVVTGSKNLHGLAVSPDGRTIAFVEETEDENIWEITPNERARPLIRSSRADHSPQISPDGARIVFVSARTGNDEIWLADADGGNPRQLTDADGSAGSPRFSPDGKFIAFDAQKAGGSDVFVVSVNGGAARRLTENAKNNGLPAWSADGERVLFSSNRTGEDQIWIMPASGGDAVQITRQGAFEMFAAPDGERVIYSKGGGKTGLWSAAIGGGGDEKPIPELGDAGAWRSWTVTADGIFYTAFAARLPLSVKFYDFASKQTRKITEAEKLPLNYYANLSVSADGGRLLYAQQDQINASIMLAELTE